MDAKGNARLQGGDQFKVDICGPACPAPEAAVDDSMDGCAFASHGRATTESARYLHVHFLTRSAPMRFDSLRSLNRNGV